MLVTARTEGLICLVAMLVVSLFFQMQSKILADQASALMARHGMSIGETVQAVVQEGFVWRVILIGVLAGVTFVLWFLALTRLDLSLVMPVVAVGLLFNTLASGAILGEALTTNRIVGAAIVTVGLVMVLRS